jgi:hypothetical protein
VRFHWSAAYQLDAFWHQGTVKWTAVRRDAADDDPFIEADDSDELLEKIRKDYAARPVARSAAQ